MTKHRVVIFTAAAAAFAALYFYFGRPGPQPGEPSHAAPGASSPVAEGKVWMCPMHPEISQDHPGTCPICGMKLVEANGGAHHEHGIHVDSTTAQRLGIRLATAQKGMIGQEIQAYGNVAADEHTLYVAHSRYEGWIKKLYVHSVGDRITAGQVLYEIYSPDLIARERTYLSSIDKRRQLLRTIPTSADTESDYVMELTMDAARDRAKLHSEEGIAIETIQKIENAKDAADVVKIVAGATGVVTQLNVREGSFVAASAPLLTLADVSRVWVDVFLYADEAGMVKVGDPATIHVPNGEAIPAKVDFIAPLAENNKVRARVYLDNRQVHLRPGAFVDVTIGAHPHDTLLLPRSAILYTAHGAMVMLSRGDGHFLPTPVETGSESGDDVEVVSGLRAGAEVAVNGQFLLDAGSSMNAAAERMHMHQP